MSDDLWSVCEHGLDLDRIAQHESVFTLANGHVGVRGSLDEGEPVGLAGTYLAGFHEIRPLPYAESWFASPDLGEVVVPVQDGTLIRLLVDDELFEVRYGELLDHERVMDMRAGTLQRSAHWRSPAGKAVKVRSTRLVSFTQRGIMAVCYEVEACNDIRAVLQSELTVDGELELEHASDDPRAAATLEDPLIPEQHSSDEHMLLLTHITKQSGLRVSAATNHVIDREDVTTTFDIAPGVGRAIITCDLRAGETLRLVKYVAYAWSGHRKPSSLRAQVRGSLAQARKSGWEGLKTQQRAYLDEFWAGADVEVDGDPELQRAARFALFGVLQAGARTERRAIAAKGLTGTGYDGHSFWDTEAYVLPVLTYTAPEAAAHALRWRFDTLDLARERAAELGLKGAAFPWRTIAGRECSGYWPAGTAGFHVNSAIAVAAQRLVRATGDEDFARDIATPLLVETARLWLSLGHDGGDGRFHLFGVTGPDEYSALSDDNLYTNLMAARNLRAAADAAPNDPDAERWRAAADAMAIPFDDRLNVHEQAAGFLSQGEWDFEGTEPGEYPLLLNFPYFDLYRKQVIKQADITFALYACGDCFTPKERARAFAVHEALTVRDSSLSACVQAIMAADTGHLELAYDYLAEAAFVDLHDLAGNTKDGLHIASLAGTWLALVAGFGGFRDHDGELRFRPRCPPHVQRLAFRLNARGARVRVELTKDKVTYALDAGEAITVFHEHEALELVLGEAVTRDLVKVAEPDPVVHPPGRAPRRHVP